MNAVLYIDDQEEELQSLRYLLADRYRVSACREARKAASIVARQKPDAVLLDINMPDYDGFRVLSDIRSLADPPPVLMLSGYPDPFFVARAIKEGAFDFVEKPYTGAMIRRKIELALAQTKPETAAAPTNGVDAARMLIGSSAQMAKVRQTIARYARSDAPVLILGESGTGKDRAARLLHALSARAAGPFEIRNVGALPETIAESELFGCENGAYTDARARKGCFETAHGGTLFLDEIADAGPSIQTALLRVVEDGTIRRLGSAKHKLVDCRLVFATNRNLDEMITQKSFREDLLYRINTLPLFMPPLRERAGDIPELVDAFLSENGRRLDDVTPEALDYLCGQPWPGNVRQLRSCIDRALVLTENDRIEKDHMLF